jgi:hypothetical protein
MPGEGGGDIGGRGAFMGTGEPGHESIAFTYWKLVGNFIELMLLGC